MKQKIDVCRRISPTELFYHAPQFYASGILALICSLRILLTENVQSNAQLHTTSWYKTKKTRLTLDITPFIIYLSLSKELLRGHNCHSQRWCTCCQVYIRRIRLHCFRPWRNDKYNKNFCWQHKPVSLRKLLFRHRNRFVLHYKRLCGYFHRY